MIRLATEFDIPQILDIYAPYILHTAVSFEYSVPTLEAFTERFRTITAQFPWVVWEKDEKVLGYAYGSLPFERAAYSWCSEVSIYLAPQIHGKGVGRQLYGVLEHIMQRQGYHVIYSLITSENEVSLRFHKKYGYIPRAEFPDCGFKFGRWLGIFWLEKRLKSVEIPSKMPTPWQAIRQDAQKFSDILDILSLS